MRSNWSCGTGAMALLVGLAVATASWAQSTPPSQGQPPTQGQHKGERGKLIEELRAAHRLLDEANHDYDGHRAKAAHEVHKAIKDLAYQHKKAESGQTPGNGGNHGSGTHEPNKAAQSGKEHEPQGNSDSQLREAHEILKTVLGQINATKHPKAAGHIKEAIHEIRLALKMK